MFQTVLFALVVILSSQAQADSFDYLPADQAAQKEFQSLMAAGNYRQALRAWNLAHRGSTFAVTSSGQATYAYLLYQNGMPLLGLQHLFEHAQPDELNSSLRSKWTKELKTSSLIQKGRVQTSRGWKKINDNSPFTLQISNQKELAQAINKAAQLRKDVNAQARILWQIATQAPQFGQVTAALKALDQLSTSGQKVIASDQILSSRGRVLYQKGDLTGAIEAFNQIPKSSSLWVESVEERAWAYLKRDDFDKTISETITLLSPALSPLVGPESYFLANLASLKICDYTRIFKNSELFKKRLRQRLTDLQELAKSGANKNLASVLDRIDKNGVSIESAGPLVESLPRSTFRDSTFTQLFENRRQLLNESQTATNIAATFAGEGTELQKLGIKAKQQAEHLKPLAIQRLRALAELEIKEYKTVINKMHIIEGEVIHRMHADDNLKGERSRLSDNERSNPDVLVFPYAGDEVWFDELDNYKARVKDCPTLKGAKL